MRTAYILAVSMFALIAGLAAFAFAPGQALAAEPAGVTYSKPVKFTGPGVSADTVVVDENGKVVLRASAEAKEKAKRKKREGDNDDAENGVEELIVVHTGERSRFPIGGPMIRALECRP